MECQLSALLAAKIHTQSITLFTLLQYNAVGDTFDDVIAIVLSGLSQRILKVLSSKTSSCVEGLVDDAKRSPQVDDAKRSLPDRNIRNIYA